MLSIPSFHTLDRDKHAVMNTLFYNVKNSLIATKTLKGIPYTIQTLVTTFISFANRFYQFPQKMILDTASATKIELLRHRQEIKNKKSNTRNMSLAAVKT